MLNVEVQHPVTFGNVDTDHVASFTDYRIKINPYKILSIGGWK